jgi:methylated-DNA-[protein]-cysteine S-methyltransferase
MNIKYTKWTCVYCDIILVARNHKLVHLHLDTGQGKKTFSLDPAWEEDTNSPILQEALEQLHAYFAGSPVAFTVPLHIEGTEFQKQVWAELVKIPFGVQQSYQDIAEAIGRPKAARAVGAAVGRNPLPLFIPCHRIIGANGALTGFASGLAIKEQLLRLEGWKSDEFYPKKGTCLPLKKKGEG